MPEAKPCDFTIVEHSGDLRIIARGRDKMEALAMAAAGLISQAVNPDGIAEVEEKAIAIRGNDDAELSIAFLNELVFLMYGRHWLPKRVRTLTQCSRKNCPELEAILVGEPVDQARHEFKYDIKAVTYHDFRLTQNDDGVTVEFVCDL
jgi:SHS2 domain-containing protein